MENVMTDEDKRLIRILMVMVATTCVSGLAVIGVAVFALVKLI